VIDTENNSSTLYDTLTDFDQCEVVPRVSGSFHYMDFVDAIKEAEAAGYDCIIIDSASHLWQAILDAKDELDKKGGNSFANWSVAGKNFNTALASILQCKMHVIACIRSKIKYEMDGGKVKKFGVDTEMRSGIEYEFTTVFDVEQDHKATASKDRTGLFVREGSFLIDESTGEKISRWIDGGADVIDRKGIFDKVKELVGNGGLLQQDVISEVKALGKDKMLDLDDESFMKVARSLGVA